MLYSFICCFKPKHIIHHKNIDVIEPKINCILDDTINFGINQINLFETKSLYDSNEWLTKLDIHNPINLKDTTQFVPPIEKGFVIKVYDGDTITIASKLPYENSPLYRFSVRLNGIDCPEIKGKDDHEKQCAQIAKQELSDLILNKIITLKNIQTEKYGRVLADVYLDDFHLNQHMLDKRLAVIYNGGTKINPKNWMEYYYYKHDV